ncbi:MAG: hypothetical protein ACFCUO_02055 [Rhodospirillales bacterium]
MDFGLYLHFALALAFVLALIGVLAVLARRLGLGYAAPSRTGRRRRLSVAEVLPLDAKRKIVLLRRDGVEHLVILGPTSEILVETGIVAPDRFADAVAEAVSEGSRLESGLDPQRGHPALQEPSP